MGIYKKLWVTSYSKIGSPKIRKKARMYVLPTFVQHYAGGSSQCNMPPPKKKNIGKIGKEEVRLSLFRNDIIRFP